MTVVERDRPALVPVIWMLNVPAGDFREVEIDNVVVLLERVDTRDHERARQPHRMRGSIVRLTRLVTAAVTGRVASRRSSAPTGEAPFTRPDAAAGSR